MKGASLIRLFFLLMVVSASLGCFPLSATERRPTWKPTRASLLFAHGGQIVSSMAIGTAPGSNACNGTGTGSICTWPNTQNTSSTTGSEPYNYIGTLSAALSFGTPPYSGGYTLMSGTPGGNCSGQTFDNTHFSISNGDLVINSGANAPVAGTTYYVCVVPLVGATTANALALTIPVHHFIDAAGTYCASHGGGSGTAASPWTDTCLTYVVGNVATAGDTIFLAAGHWAFSYSNPAVSITQGINVVGAGSGNTFDTYGHPNNAYCATYGTSGSTFDCLTNGTFTRLYQSSGCSQSASNCGTINNGFMIFQNCTAASLSHVFLDGSVNSAGGGSWALVNFANCRGANINDIRAYGNGNPNTQSAESQFYVRDQVGGTPLNVSVQNSVFAEPPVIDGNGDYPASQTFQNSAFDGFNVKNNAFYMFPTNVFYVDNSTIADSINYFACDAIGCSNIIASSTYSGCTIGGCYNGSTTGNYHDYFYNNYFNGGTVNVTSVGSGVNDPGTSGVENDIQVTGNWIFGPTIEIATTCGWHIYGTYCAPGTTSGAVGQQMNLNGNGYSFLAQNNSLIASTTAEIDATSGGCSTSGAGASCGSGLFAITTYGLNSTKNYLSSPNNQYLTDSTNLNIIAVNPNFCSGSSANFAGCSTSGFTTAPTCTFTLGPLAGSVAPVTATTFTAQYGAVQYIAQAASSPPSTPTTGDARWNSYSENGGINSYIPPYSIAASHGNTVYMWVMDNANHIAQCTATGSAVVY